MSLQNNGNCKYSETYTVLSSLGIKSSTVSLRKSPELQLWNYTLFRKRGECGELITTPTSGRWDLTLRLMC